MFVCAGNAGRLKGSGGFKKKKNEIFIPFFPRCCCWWCRSAQSHWGEMHIEEALGNIWCRRQSGDITPLVETLDAEYGCPLIPRCMQHHVGSHIKGAIWKVHLPPLSNLKWRLDELIGSASSAPPNTAHMTETQQPKETWRALLFFFFSSQCWKFVDMKIKSCWRGGEGGGGHLRWIP